jgi:hypothetical protein
MALVDKMSSERLDESGLADSRHARDADANAATGVWRKRLQQLTGGSTVIGATRFDQRDGSRDRGALPRQHPVGQRRHIGHKVERIGEPDT